MVTYTCLLRGINVGGKNRVVMKELRQHFFDLGYLEVETYINSGNVIFKSNNTDIKTLKKDIELMIQKELSLDIEVVIIEKDQLRESLRNAPKWWNKDKDDINYVLFPIYPTAIDDVYEAAGDIVEDKEFIYNDEYFIYWNTSRDDFKHTRYSKLASLPIGKKVTIRNANTTLKLLDLMNK